MTFQSTQMKVIQWAESRRIIPNASPEVQMLKAVSEIGEVADELIKGNKDALELELGDVLVTLIIFGAMLDIDLQTSLAKAYDKIKDRKGTMMPNGVFVKE
jgi:NTP pyrophosphatase (non-canonical NTP hydrolase)